MSDIKVGDLVVIIGGSNPNSLEHIGKIATVLELSNVFPGHWRLEPPTISSNGKLMSWHPKDIKRVPPLSELESAERQERDHPA